ncbi:hypothetical protein CKO12_06935 [Chromatium okenii]|nr:hypothetical protein [Chromatium okenii]
MSPLVSDRAQTTNASARTNYSASFATTLNEKLLEATSTRDVSSAPIEKYDFSNMTPIKFRETINVLISRGQMDLDETTPLIGMMPFPLSKVNCDGTLPAGFDQPVDFLAKIQYAIKETLSRNDRQGAEGLRIAGNALLRFHQAM